MRYTLGPSSDLALDFDNQSPVTADNILEGNLMTPKTAGEKENFVLSFNNLKLENITTR